MRSRPVLRHRVEIQKLVIYEDEIGEQITEWETIAEVWASISPLRGKEYWAAAQVQSETTHEVIMRYPGVEITPAHQLVFKGRTLNIQSVINVEERNRELQLLCKEKV